MLALTVAKGPDRGVKFELRGKNSVIIGRNSADLKLSDIMISRYHARLKEVDGRWYVRDLGSRNGTKLNGERLLRTQALREGDLITTGLTVLEFHVVPDPADRLTPAIDTDDDSTDFEDHDESIAMAELPRAASRPGVPPQADRPAEPPAASAVAVEAADHSISTPFEKSDAGADISSLEQAAALPQPPADVAIESASSDWPVNVEANVDAQAARVEEEAALEQQSAPPTHAEQSIPEAVEVRADVAAVDSLTTDMASSHADRAAEPPVEPPPSLALSSIEAVDAAPAAIPVPSSVAVNDPLPVAFEVRAPAEIAPAATLAAAQPEPDPIAIDAAAETAPTTNESAWLEPTCIPNSQGSAIASSVMASVELSMELPALQELAQPYQSYYSDNSADIDAARQGDEAALPPQPVDSEPTAASDIVSASAPRDEGATDAVPTAMAMPERAAALTLDPIEAAAMAPPAATESETVQATAFAAPVELPIPDEAPAKPIADTITSVLAVPVEFAAPVQSSTLPQPARGGEQAASEWFAAVESQVQVVEGQGWEVEPGDDDDLIGLSAIADPLDSSLDSEARQRLYWDDDDHWTDDDDDDITAATALGDLDLPGLDRILSQPVELGEAPAPSPVPVAATRSHRINQAGERIVARDFAAAESLLRTLQEESPTDPRSLEMLVMLLEFTGRRGDAGILIEARLRQFPRDTHVLQLASLFHERARTAGACDTLDASVGALFRSLSASEPVVAGLPSVGSPPVSVAPATQGRHKAKSRRNAP